MTDGDALLAAILANPEEDTPRLVYADWLQENGQPERAEFIRVQCEKATWGTCGGYALGLHGPGGPRCPECDRRTAATSRERGLLAERWREWVYLPEPYVSASYPAEVGSGSPEVNVDGVTSLFRRGFVERVTCPAADWLAHADALCWHPGQTVRCPQCNGSGMVRYDFGPPHQGWHTHPCGTCSQSLYSGGSGTVSRPCPPTAQPIRRVRLTTWPGQTPGWPRLTLVTPDGEGHVYEPWPGVVFGMPATATPGQVLTATADGPRWTDPDPEPLPLDGWRIEIYRHQPQEPGWYIDPPARADLTLRVELPPDVARPANDLPGTRVGPLAATDTFGRRWRVESAVVVDTVRFDASRGRREMVVTARSAGRIDPG